MGRIELTQRYTFLRKEKKTKLTLTQIGTRKNRT
jgi:hypothetical protein